MVTSNEGNPLKDSEGISIVKGIKQAVTDGDVTQLKPVLLDTSPYTLRWPNRAMPIPDEVFNDGISRLMVPDGFLIPGHRGGGVYIISLDPEDISKATKTQKITVDKGNYWYHTGEWIDLNGNGRLDLLTARTDSVRGENSGELVWLEHPEDPNGEWKEHFICKGPQVFFSIDRFPEYPDEIVVWSAEFFMKRLSFYRIKIDGGVLVDSRVLADKDIF